MYSNSTSTELVFHLSGEELLVKNETSTYEEVANVVINEIYEKFYVVSNWINVISITLITLFGIYGNLVSMIIFLSNSYNKNSIKSLSIYLVLLALSDFSVLILHYVDFTFRTWINLTQNYSSQFNFIDKCSLCCKLFPYLRNVFRTLSVYSLVFMTLQRFMLIYFPSFKRLVTSAKFSIYTAVMLVIFCLLPNVNILFVNELEKNPYNGESFCSIHADYIHVQFKFDFLFVTLTILLPSIVIFIIGLVLQKKIRFMSEGPVNLSDQKALTPTHEPLDTLDKKRKITEYLDYMNTKFPQMPNLENIQMVQIDEVIAGGNHKNSSSSSSSFSGSNRHRIKQHSMDRCASGNGISSSARRKRSASKVDSTQELNLKKKLRHSIRTTYMLLVLSKWFILLQVPYFVCWCFYYSHLAQSILYKTPPDSYFLNKRLILKTLLQLSEIFFLFNYSINFILYLMYGPTFRKAHRQIIFGFLQSTFYHVTFCCHQLLRYFH